MRLCISDVINPAQIRIAITGKRILGRYGTRFGMSCQMQPKAIDAKNRFALWTVQQHSSLLV
jgi:hypothetical protein